MRQHVVFSVELDLTVDLDKLVLQLKLHLQVLLLHEQNLVIKLEIVSSASNLGFFPM